MHFEIRYSVAGGFEDQALALARRLFAVYDEAIESLALLPVDDDFTLALNGTIVASQCRDGRAPTVADVRAILGKGMATSGQPGHAGAPGLDTA